LVIRCERCSTMYELDEKLLAPTGSDVQCTKCQHVFKAFPPGSAGRTLVGVPGETAQPEVPKSSPAAPTAAQASSRPAVPAPGTVAAPRSLAGRPDGAAPRGVRPGSTPVYRPSPTAPGAASSAVGRAPVIRRDTVGTFEARLRWTARWRWLAPLLGVALVGTVVAAWLLLGRRTDVGSDRTQGEALALVALDDRSSLETGAARLAVIVERAPKLRGAAADHALAQVLRAASVADEGEALAARLAARAEERERLRREQPAGWEAAEHAAETDAAALEPEVRGREEKARALAAGAREELVALQGEVGDTPEVVRAQAALHALAGERDRVHKLVRGRDKGQRDGWLDLVDGWSDAREPDRAARERAVVKLGALAAARPDLLRGRYLLARAQASLGRKAEAVATLDGLLAANGHHEGARRLRDELTAPPPAAPVGVPTTTPAPPPAPPGKGPPLWRKPVPQRGPAASPPDSAAAQSTGGAAAAPAAASVPPTPAPAPRGPVDEGPAMPPASTTAPPTAPAPDAPPPPSEAPQRPARRRIEFAAPGSSDG